MGWGWELGLINKREFREHTDLTIALFQLNTGDTEKQTPMPSGGLPQEVTDVGFPKCINTILN